MNGKFAVVTLDENGYIFYECKYTNTKVNEKVIKDEIAQVKATGLDCYKYGFFAKNGFEKIEDEKIITYHLDELFNVSL